MKSTLFTIVLMAVSSMAMADITYISNAGNTPHVINSPTDITWVGSGALSSSVKDVVLPTESNVAKTFTSTDYTNSATFGNTNVGKGGSWTYTLIFDIASIAEEKSITQIDIDFLSANSVGKPQNNENGFNATITLSSGESNLHSSSETIVTSVGDNGTESSAYGANSITLRAGVSYNQFSITGLDLAAGSYELTISFSQSRYTGGVFAGVGNIALHADVPESSTAVLSLLAVVGLVARRRRRA